ncbi:MAG TPA: 16S rRNA (uracil(1498)-N(3))-methyltransferase [Polyangia bacterium]|jgi:16S rRNA (uracil1498-N3)-methyltransferase|nr:16S rRNA (uracil(1498)-N(3))-methyltransferase [Polyangia bacterium]
MRRLFVPREQWIGSRAVVDGDAHRHLTRVLRARPGDALCLFDGQGGEIDAVVETIERDRTTLSLGAPRAAAIVAGARIVLLQSLARGERMDWIIQKTTELGVTRVVPVAAERSVARLSAAEAPARRARWQKIAREAARQCGRADVPDVGTPVALAGALEDSRAELAAAGGAGFALWEGSRGRPLRVALAVAPRAVALLVGPEGGFTDGEIAAAEAAGFQVAGLGPRILRVETAAVVAVALAQAAAGGLD